MGFEAGSLSTIDMGIQKRLHEWQCARRLKAAINTFVALLRMSSNVRTELPNAAEQADILRSVHADAARVEVLQASFSMLDRDSSGVVSIQNIAESMKALGVEKKSSEVSAMLTRFDVHKTGVISFDEFCIM